MPLAFFDLDNTLLAGDSDRAWGEFLAQRRAVDPVRHGAEHERHHRAYLEGTLDVQAYFEFSLRPLRDNDRSQLEAWRDEFVNTVIEAMIPPAALGLVARHRDRGDTLLIVTATNRFLTESVAERFGVDHLLATEPAEDDGRFTGAVAGEPCYREGKVAAVQRWLALHRRSLAASWFYSDSHNDLPLLDRVDNPVAVNPDYHLEVHARQRGWPVMHLY